MANCPVGRCSIPEHGDLVIAQGTRDELGVYIVRSTPGPDQLVVGTRDAALEHARRFAKHQHVRVWLTDVDNNCTLVDDFRMNVNGD